MNLVDASFEQLERTYRITPIQEPEKGAAFQRAYLSRIPLAPPLIIQFDCWDKDGELTIPYDELPFLVCHLSLLTEDGEDAQMIVDSDGEMVSMLYGTLVATPSEMNDVAGSPGVYFVFPDVSVRYTGRFRLQAYVMRVTGGHALDSCSTDTFEIVSDYDYIAPPMTELSRHFEAQGVVNFGTPRGEW